MRVLFISGYTGKALTQYGVADKDVHLLIKPFSSRALADAVRCALDGVPMVS